MYTVTIFKGKDVLTSTFGTLREALRAALDAKNDWPLSEVKVRTGCSARVSAHAIRRSKRRSAIACQSR